MTRKDYVAVSDAIRRAYKEEPYMVRELNVIYRDSVSIVADRLADVFEKDNPAFSKVLFMLACKGE